MLFAFYGQDDGSFDQNCNFIEEKSMVKNVIFDLDNTIIRDHAEDAICYKEVLKKNGYNENDYLRLNNATFEYDITINEDNCKYDKNKMLEFINDKLNTNYTIELIDEIFEAVGKHWIKDIILKENIVKYLFNKYDLYIYTNYFEECQVKRIENIGYAKYFKKIFCADRYGAKQFKKCFEKVLNEINCMPYECIFIGDTFKTDIVSANNIGMKAILFDCDNKYNGENFDYKNNKIIHNMNELLNIL